MPKSRPITAEELAAIKWSVRVASSVVFKRMGVETFDKQAKLKPNVPKWKLEQERWLLCLRWEDGRAPWIFSHKSSKRIVLRAMDAYDLEFFIKLGAVLKKKKGFFWVSDRISKLEHFLLKHWAKPIADMPELFRLTPGGLTDVCSHCLGVHYSEEAVVKTRQRLGLKTFKRAKILVERVGKRLRFLPPDNQR